MKNDKFSSVFNKMVANFVPQEDDEARISMQGTVVVKTNTPNGKEWIDKDGNIYMDDLVTDFPVFTVARNAKDVKVGDIVKLTKSTFAVVTEITEAGKIETLSFGGQHREAKAFKDMLLGQATVRVVVNYMQGIDTNNNNINPWMLLSFLDKDGDDRNDLLKTIMLSSMLSGAGQNPMGDLFKNPMALSFLMKGDNSSIQEMMLMQALMNGGLGNFFAAPVANKD